MSADSSHRPALSEAAVWSDSPVSLKDFAARHPIPNLARVTKGQYKHIGVARSTCSDLYVHSIQIQYKLLADLIVVKVKDGKTRAVTISDQKYALPLTYLGWFEVLSADGCSVAPLQYVSELRNATNFITRHTLKAFGSRNNGDDIAFDVQRTLARGEELSVRDDVLIPVPPPHGNNKHKHFLRCVDSRGDIAFLDMEQKGAFSVVAGPLNIAGVHKLNSLVEKFRLPIMVRLVHGTMPDNLDKYVSSGGIVFRLLALYSDELVFVNALRGDNSTMTPISTREPLKLMAATNFTELRSTVECQYHIAHCAQMMASYMNSIHSVYSIPDPLSVPHAVDSAPSSSDHHSSRRQNNSLGDEESIIQEEIDDLYGYVRRGGEPPAPRSRPRPTSTTAAAKPSSTTKGNSSALASQPTAAAAAAALPNHQHNQTESHYAVPADLMQQHSDATHQLTNDSHYQLLDRQRAISSRNYTTPSGDERGSSANNKGKYWDEPIYEPIDKYRIKPDAGGSKEDNREVDVPSPKFLTPDTSLDRVQSNRITSPDVAAPPLSSHLPSRAVGVSSPQPYQQQGSVDNHSSTLLSSNHQQVVKTLREVIKMNQPSQGEDSASNPVTPPPLPPQRPGLITSSSSSSNTAGAVNHLYSSVTPKEDKPKTPPVASESTSATRDTTTPTSPAGQLVKNAFKHWPATTPHLNHNSDTNRNTTAANPAIAGVSSSVSVGVGKSTLTVSSAPATTQPTKPVSGSAKQTQSTQTQTTASVVGGGMKMANKDKHTTAPKYRSDSRLETSSNRTATAAAAASTGSNNNSNKQQHVGPAAGLSTSTSNTSHPQSSSHPHHFYPHKITSNNASKKNVALQDQKKAVSLPSVTHDSGKSATTAGHVRDENSKQALQPAKVRQEQINEIVAASKVDVKSAIQVFEMKKLAGGTNTT